MSFKRDTNDLSYINSLRQRRIKDLLAEDIPEDEASLLSNGRFACTVCHHKPVFDTVDMLTVHRNGKKHQASICRHEHEKEELRELIKQRRHEEFLKTGSTDIKIAESHMNTLLNSVPYDSRVKRKLKPYDRKPKLSLGLSVGATPSSKLPGNRTHEMIKMQEDGPIKHPNQLKKLFEKPNSTFIVQPYQSKSGRVPERTDNCMASGVTENQMPCSSGVEKLDQSSTGDRNMLSSDQNHSSKSTRRVVSPLSTDTEKTFSNGGTSVSKVMKPEQKELAKKYWQMAGSGWRKDWDGKWIRDEDCEFDSDEEPPDLP